MQIIQDGNQAHYKPSAPRKVRQSLLPQAYENSSRNIVQVEIEARERKERGERERGRKGEREKGVWWGWGGVGWGGVGWGF